MISCFFALPFCFAGREKSGIESSYGSFFEQRKINFNFSPNKTKSRCLPGSRGEGSGWRGRPRKYDLTFQFHLLFYIYILITVLIV